MPLVVLLLAVSDVALLLDGAWSRDWLVEVLVEVLRLPEAAALPEPLKLPELLVELEGADVALWSRFEGAVVDEVVLLVAPDCADDDMDEAELLEEGVLLLGDVVVEELLAPDLGCVVVEVWACRQSAAAKRAGVPARMNFNGRFMVVFS